MVPIIVLCGQAGSGKSTLGTYLSYNHGATCIALADPIKRICQYVFEFTDEQLWGPSQLRGEVDKRDPKNIEKLLDQKTIWSDPGLYGVLPPAYNPTFARSCFSDWAEGCFLKTKEGLTPRYCLQTLGTEWGRAIDPNLWIKIGLDTATKLLEDPSLIYIPSKGIQKRDPEIREWKTGGIVITDGRFRNEILEVKKVGGIAVDLRRGGLPKLPKTHPSETELEGIPLHWFDYVIFNNSNMRDLHAKADSLISKVWHPGEAL